MTRRHILFRLSMLKKNLIRLILTMTAVAIATPASEIPTGSFVEANFFVGIEPYPIYVEPFLHAKPTHELPIILIHGGVCIEAGYVSTPDGREMWSIYLVKHGWKTWVRKRAL